MLVPLSRTIPTPFVWLISPLLPGSSSTVTFLGKPFPQTQSPLSVTLAYFYSFLAWIKMVIHCLSDLFHVHLPC